MQTIWKDAKVKMLKLIATLGHKVTPMLHTGKSCHQCQLDVHSFSCFLPFLGIVYVVSIQTELVGNVLDTMQIEKQFYKNAQNLLERLQLVLQENPGSVHTNIKLPNF